MSEMPVIEQCTRTDGSVDWNKVAKLTHYAVSVEMLAPVKSLTASEEPRIIDLKLPETVAAPKA